MTPNQPSTLGERLARRVSASPDTPAFLTEQAPGRWTPVDWHGFAQRVEQTQRALAAWGLRRGDRLGLIAAVSLDWEVVHHAALGMGVAVVALDGHDLPERLGTMLDLAEVAGLITDQPALAQRLAPTDGRRRALLLDGPDARGTGGGGHPPALSDLSQAAASTPLPPAAGPGDTATIIFTSGTTGAPKGIAYSHAQLCLAVDAICDAFQFVGPGSRLLCWLPLSNLFQRVVNLAAMNNGAATYLLPDPRQVMAAVAAVEPDVFIGVPRFYDKLHDGIRDRLQELPHLLGAVARAAWSVARRATDLRLDRRRVPWTLALAHRLAEALVLRRVRAVMGRRLRCMVSGSAPLSLHVLRDLEALGWPVLEAYGLSENVLPMAMNRIDDRRAGTVGRPLHGNDLVLREDGMVRVRGPGVFTGYLGEPPDSGRDAEGYYLTGDLGAFDDDGYLRLTGRAGDLIKTSTGRRIAPAAVEAGLRTAPGVDQAVLFGAGRKVLIALVTLTEPIPEDQDARAALEAGLRDAVTTLPPHERPAGIAVLPRALAIDTGELTANLKLRRAAIEQLHGDRLDRLSEQVDRLTGTPGPTVLWPEVATVTGSVR